MKFRTFKTILFFFFFLAQFQAYSQCQVEVKLYEDDTPANGLWEAGTETEVTSSPDFLKFLIEVDPSGYNSTDPSVTAVNITPMVLSEGVYKATVDCDKNYIVMVQDSSYPSFVLGNSGTYDYTPTTGDNDNDFVGRQDVLTSGGSTFQSNVSVSGLVTFPPGTTYVSVYGGGNATGVLPVELVSFRCMTNKDCSVDLEWATATENENKGFSIERSTDGRKFEAIAFVDGAGNTSETVSYSFADENPARENYYRLKQVDYDGTYEYSKTVYVNNECKNTRNEITLFPSPAKNFLNLESTLGFEGTTRVTVSDYSGKIHLSHIINNADAGSNEKIDISDLAEGLYFVRIMDESNQIYPAQKIMKY